MSINNTPTIEPEQVTGIFVNYIAKTLPLAFDDSMSYYECLCALLKYINDTIVPDINNVNSGLGELQGFYEELQSYVNNYFDNLDVQEEINNKLDQMAADGSLTNLIKAYVDPIQEAFETNIQTQINVINNKVNSIADINPIPVSSTSGMTDTTRIYVNTTDGYWYYYDESEWTQGGVYQATQVGDGAIVYNNLENLLKKQDFIEIHAEDLLWKKGKGVTQGFYNSDAVAISSSPFILPKGNTITIDTTTFKYRITYYDLNYNYISNTGSYSSSSATWSYSDTCMVIISIAKIEGEAEETDCTNTNISFTGVIEKENYELGKSILTGGFTKMGSTRMYVSKPFFLEIGTKISLSPDLLMKNESYPTYGLMYFNIQEENIQKDISNAGIAVQKGYYTATQSGMVRLSIAFVSTDDMSETYYNKLPAILKLEKIPYIEDETKILCYSSNNGNIDYFYNDGSLYIKIYSDFTLVKNGGTLLSIDMENLEESFPNNIETINDIKYFKLTYNQVLIYDTIANELKLTTFASSTILLGHNTIIIAANKYNCFADGIMLNYINKLNYDYMFIKNDMFNSHPIRNYDWKTIVSEFNALYNDLSSNIDSFVFFTDPHLAHAAMEESTLIKYLNPLEKVYNSTPTEFIICGGDWLSNGDSENTACYKLGYIDGFMNSKFKNYYPILGNHDTNYQGEDSLEHDTLINLLFSKEKNTYYSFKANNSINYVLDTGLDSANTMTDYRWTQVNWLAEKLAEDNPEHGVVFMHIVWAYNSGWILGCMVNPVTSLIDAYNNHTTITLNGINYDFTSNTGHIDYVLSGHTHEDHYDTINNVLCVATNRLSGSDVPTYDIVINDYGNGKLIMYRVGTGSSREFDI